MTLTSVGYAGSVTPAQWAGLTKAFGARYGAGGAGDWKVTTVAGQDRTVSIAAGQGFGHGVLDTTDTAQTVQLAIVASGARWDTIVARRTWGSTNATTLIAVQGSATQGIAAGRQVNPGVVDDQPIALVQVTAGQQLPTAVVDVRCWHGDGGMVAASSDALGYLDDPGSVVWVGGVQWVRQVAANGTTSWVAAVSLDVVGSVLSGSGYTGQALKRRIRGGNFPTDSNGELVVMPAAAFSGVVMATLVGAGGDEVTAAWRIDSGNLVARIWRNGVRAQNANVSAVADITYW